MVLQPAPEIEKDLLLGLALVHQHQQGKRHVVQT